LPHFLSTRFSALGPAEVVTWAMLGFIWSMMKYLSDGIADAAEVRCALHLVSNQPELARLSAYKSLFLGLVTSIFTSSILFMVGAEVAPLITPDPTLQRLMIEVFPLIGMGHIVMTIGIISWALVGAQGRYTQATIIQFICNWGVTIPLSSLFTYGLRIDLQGLTSAFVLGLALSGAANTYVLVRSEWQRLASIISIENQLDEAEIVHHHHDASSPARVPRTGTAESSSRRQRPPSSLLEIEANKADDSSVSDEVSWESRLSHGESF
jgi:Na+-driven multidrug efflux pump